MIAINDTCGVWVYHINSGAVLGRIRNIYSNLELAVDE